MVTSYWFRPKRYGYGATPITWQGWAVTIAAGVVVLVVTALVMVRNAESPWFWVALAIDAAVIAALWITSRRMTDGDWRWRWGND